MKFLLRWINNTVSVFVATYLVHSITYKEPLDLIIAALFLGVLNAFVRPVLKFLSLPIIVLTLGLFIFVINGVMLYLVGAVMKPDFNVPTFKAAFWGALVITIVSMVLNFLTGTNRATVKVQRPPPPPDRHDGGGPIIDV